LILKGHGNQGIDLWVHPHGDAQVGKPLQNGLQRNLFGVNRKLVSMEVDLQRARIGKGEREEKKYRTRYEAKELDLHSVFHKHGLSHAAPWSPYVLDDFMGFAR
jgi:hypothetical protein